MPDLIIDPATLTACAKAACAYDAARISVAPWDELDESARAEYRGLVSVVLLTALASPLADGDEMSKL